MRDKTETWNDCRTLNSVPMDVQFLTLKVTLIVLLGTLGIIGVQI